MKIVVIGGTGLIGSKVVSKLREQGNEAVPAAPNTGVNTLTGEGLAEVLKGADVVVDVSNSPSFEDAAVLNFFTTSTTNLLQAEAAAGVRHHVALSVVGTDRLSESGYMRAKVAQEKLIEQSSIPYSIVHATQFFEFMKGIADGATVGDTVRLAPVLIQPTAAEDVATEVAKVAVGAPVNGIVEVSGPEQFRLALSLHAPVPGLRRELMPIEKKYALPEVMKALAQFKRRVTLEYVLIGGVNDSLETADHLAKLARPLGALVNLLPLHPGGAPDLAPSPHAQMLAFERRLKRLGVAAVLRRSRGLDISAACGQLRVELGPRRRKVGAEEHAGVE